MTSDDPEVHRVTADALRAALPSTIRFSTGVVLERLPIFDGDDRALFVDYAGPWDAARHRFPSAHFYFPRAYTGMWPPPVAALVADAERLDEKWGMPHPSAPATREAKAIGARLVRLIAVRDKERDDVEPS